MSRILVVDDSAMDLRHATALLEQAFASSTIDTAENGKQALAKIAEQPPSLVVTDLRMPEMDGVELVAAITEQHSYLPIVLMTAAGNESMALEALRNGASIYIPKTELINELTDRVRKILGDAKDRETRMRLLSSISQVTFRFPNDLSLLTAFTHELREFIGERTSLSRNDGLRIRTAVEEALANAYYHGNLGVQSDLRDNNLSDFHDLANERLQQQPYRERTIVVELTLDQDLSISIRDEGEGFDPESLPDPLTSGFVERAGGRGVLLMRSFMDRVQFNDAGNEVTLVKFGVS